MVGVLVLGRWVWLDLEKEDLGKGRAKPKP
jgi:hypothetical protein